MDDFLDIDDDIDLESESVPMFPPIRRGGKPERNLALMETNKLYDTFGHTIAPKDYDDLVYCMFEFNLMVYVNSITDPYHFKFLEDCIHDQQAKIICSKKGKPLSIRIKRKSRTRWIILFTSWGLDPTMESLFLLKRLYEYMEVGFYGTPGGLGNATMLKSWRDNNLLRHTTCNGYCDNFLRDFTSGGRCDTPGLGNEYPLALEYDLSSGYLAHYMSHPTRSCGRFGNGRIDEYATYFANCDIDVRRTLPLGPFPLREKSKEYKTLLSYPTEQGLYTNVYLWKKQVDLCTSLGLDVRVNHGYGWREMTNDNAAWCYWIYYKLTHADKDLKPLIKLCIVAPIGRHGMSNTFYQLIPEEQRQEGDEPLFEGGDFYAYYVRTIHDYSSANMLHWHGYTIMECNTTLFNFAYPFADNGTLIATNYDSVMVVPHEEYYKIGMDRSQADNCPPGTWRWEELHNVKVRAARSFESDEKTVLPGIAREDR